MILVQCTKSKHGAKCPAEKLYAASALFRKMRRYAQARNEEWRILSAKYGLIRPEQEIEPYDNYGIEEKYAEIIVDEIEMYADDVTILGGRQYVDPLRDELESRGIKLHDPLQGLKIGERMHWLDKRTKELENTDITDA